MTPIEQLKEHFSTRTEEYSEEIVNFVKLAVSSYNSNYAENCSSEGMMAIHLLMYNVETLTYDKRILVPDNDNVMNSKETVILAIMKTMMGIHHPLYCVGYCLSADGFMSEYSIEDMDIAEALRVANDPLKREMIAHSISSVTGTERMIVYLVNRENGDIKLELHDKLGSDARGEIGGEFSHIFEKANETCTAMEAAGMRIFRDNIFSNESE